MDVKFGDIVRWEEDGEVVSGRVTFVDPPSVRVVPAGASEQLWMWVDLDRLLAPPPAVIPGQLDIFGGVA